MLIRLNGVKIYAHCYLYLVGSVMLGVMLYAHCYTWSEALCPLLYMELINME